MREKESGLKSAVTDGFAHELKTDIQFEELINIHDVEREVFLERLIGRLK